MKNSIYFAFLKTVWEREIHYFFNLLQFFNLQISTEKIKISIKNQRTFFSFVMSSLIFYNLRESYQNFLTFGMFFFYVFMKRKKSRILDMFWYEEFTLLSRSFRLLEWTVKTSKKKNRKRKFRSPKKFREKSTCIHKGQQIHFTWIQKGSLLILSTIFLLRLVNNFLSLLFCKINVLSIFHVVDLFSDFYFIEKYKEILTKIYF